MVNKYQNAPYHNTCIEYSWQLSKWTISQYLYIVCLKLCYTVFHKCVHTNLQLQCCYFTLYFYNNEPSKNKHFLILLSSLARYSQEPRLKRMFEILWVLFEKISVFYSDWPKSWIWRTLGHVRDIVCKCHFRNTTRNLLV